MCRDTIRIPVRNGETLVRARFWSQVLFDVTAKFQDWYIIIYLCIKLDSDMRELCETLLLMDLKIKTSNTLGE